MKANLGVDLFVIVYEICNATVLNHSSIISSNMALECPDIVFYPANMRCWPNVGLLLAHCLRSWHNSKPALSQRLMFVGYVQYLLHMYNSATPYIEAWVAIYQVDNRFIRISNISFSAHFLQSLKSYEHLHFSDPVVDISDRHVENVIFLGKTNTAIHGPHINGMGASIVLIFLTIMW